MYFAMKSISVVLKIAFFGVIAAFAGSLQAQPGFRSDVQKEYDENGNILRYDSTWSWSDDGGSGLKIDSIFMQFFRDHPFSYEFDWDRMPNLNDTTLDFSRHFNFHPDFPEPFINEDFEKLFNEHMEMMKRYFHTYPFPGDSIRYYNPGRQSLPGQQKKSNRTIDI
jgi:hypothetical protein